MEIVKNLVSPDKYGIKCPYEMVPEFIVVHNTYNDASARNEIAYMISNNSETSFHYAIDDKEIVQGIPENRNAWHASDGWKGSGNRKGIAIEICFSESGGERFADAEILTAKFIAFKLKEKGWGIDRVKKHRDFVDKDCPHRTMALGWERFLDLVRKEMEEKPANVLTGLPLLGNGSRGDSVKAMQLLLIGYGYGCGSFGADGIFGNATDLAVRVYQKEKGLVVDGYCGPETWSSLLGVKKA